MLEFAGLLFGAAAFALIYYLIKWWRASSGSDADFPAAAPEKQWVVPVTPAAAFNAKPYEGPEAEVRIGDFLRGKPHLGGDMIQNHGPVFLTMTPSIAAYLVWVYGASLDELVNRLLRTFPYLKLTSSGVLLLGGNPIYKIIPVRSDASDLSILFLTAFEEWAQADQGSASPGLRGSLGSRSNSNEGLFEYVKVDYVYGPDGTETLGIKLPFELKRAWTDIASIRVVSDEEMGGWRPGSACSGALLTSSDGWPGACEAPFALLLARDSSLHLLGFPHARACPSLCRRGR